ncbi:MAG: hypothetical protein J5J00_07700 [Deltaproteobacteria bacterium]|nr:hypothetical protein [Deltaproteobacteria bacterium]
MKKLVDYLVYLLIRGCFWLIAVLPQRLALALLTGLVRGVLMLLPRYRRIADRNLKQAFPESTPEWRRSIFNDSCASLARLILDFARIKRLNEEWVKRNVEIPEIDKVDQILRTPGRRSAIFVTGHLGSFELLAHSANILGYPQSFIVRNFKNEFIDRWWNTRRESQGNIVINRKGAFRTVINALESGRDVGILFDQNTKRNHAVFVDFFGRPAATTKTVGLAALKTEAIILVVSIQYKGNDQYRINWEHCDFEATYRDNEIGSDEKVKYITEVVSKKYEEMIRRDPGAWFWLHRRWKTAPEGVAEDFYK